MSRNYFAIVAALMTCAVMNAACTSSTPAKDTPTATPPPTATGTATQTTTPTPLPFPTSTATPLPSPSPTVTNTLAPSETATRIETLTPTPTLKPTAWWSTDLIGFGPQAQSIKDRFGGMPPNTALPSHVVDFTDNNKPYVTFWATVVGGVRSPQGQTLAQLAFFDLDNNPNQPRFLTYSPAQAGNQWDVSLISPGEVLKVIISPEDFDAIMTVNNPTINIIGGTIMNSKVSVGDARPLFPSSQ